ncbi:MAG: MBL fold metallo-hydrolase [Coprococcus sp.]|nr:MBL fold metallo-hydrolase [Coprococcus sp.]
MKIELFVTGIISTNCYIVSNEETREAVIVDPANVSRRMKEYIESEGLTVKAVLLTHAHFDHIMGIDKLIALYGSMPVYVEEEDLELLHTPEMNESTVYTAGYSYPGGEVIHGGEILHLIGHDFQVIHTPGHTAGGVCYYVEKEGVLFSGDTLFCCSVGRTDFATSSTSALVRSVREKLFLLPDKTVVYPGHMGATTIGNEKVNNPFV